MVDNIDQGTPQVLTSMLITIKIPSFGRLDHDKLSQNITYSIVSVNEMWNYAESFSSEM